MSQQEILIIEIMIFFFTAVFLWIRYSKLRYNSSDIDSIKISFLKAGVCTTVSIGLGKHKSRKIPRIILK